MIPSKLPNRESGPQNHPRANVAVSILAGKAASMGGIVVLGLELVFKFSMIVSSSGIEGGSGPALPKLQAWIHKPRVRIDMPSSFI